MQAASFTRLYSLRAIMALGSVFFIVFTHGCKSNRTTPSVSSSSEKPAATPSNVQTDTATSKCQSRTIAASQNSGRPTAQQLRIFSLHGGKDAKAAQDLIASDPAVVNIKNKEGRTPLVEIASAREMVVRFATNGIGVARDAPAAEVSPIVKLLVENGADVDAGDSDGISALMWSAILGKTGLGAYLIENCADVNRTLSAKDLEGWTALHFAAGHGNIGLAKALLSAGAKINLPTTKGETPLAVARRFKQKAMVQFLLQSGAS